METEKTAEEAKNKYLASYGERYEKGLEKVLEEVVASYLPQAQLGRNNDESLKLVIKCSCLMFERLKKEMIEELENIPNDNSVDVNTPENRDVNLITC